MSPAPRRPSVLALAGLFLLISVGAALVSASATTPAAQALTLRDDADDIMKKTYIDFLKDKSAKPEPFNWTDDGCSGPTPIKWTYRKIFHQPCQQHDFGYRNYGGGLRLGRTKRTRLWIDRRFHQEMRRLCDKRWPGASLRSRAGRAACKDTALNVLYSGVRVHASRAFFTSEPRRTLPGQSDPASWELGTGGLGPIKLGKTAKEVRAVGVTTDITRGQFCDWWTVPGLEGVSLTAPHSSGSTLRNVGLYDRSGHGAFGVENGDSFSFLEARAGLPLHFQSEDESLHAAYYRMYSADRRTSLQFTVDTETREVLRQEAGYPGEFNYPDGIEMCG